MTETMMELDNATKNLRCSHCGKYPFPSSPEEMKQTSTTAVEEILRKYAVDDLGESVIRGIVADLADLEAKVREEERLKIMKEAGVAFVNWNEKGTYDKTD